MTDFTQRSIAEYRLYQLQQSGSLWHNSWDRFSHSTSNWLLSRATIWQTLPSWGASPNLPGNWLKPIGAFYDSQSTAHDNAPAIAHKTTRAMNAHGQALTAKQLFELDADKDGQLSVSEAASVRLWADNNEDGRIDPGELLGVNTPINSTDYSFYTRRNGQTASAGTEAMAVAPAVPISALPVPGMPAYTGVPDSNYLHWRQTETFFPTISGYLIWESNQIMLTWNKERYDNLVGTDGDDRFDVNSYASVPAHLNVHQKLHLVKNFMAGPGNDTIGGSDRSDNLWGGTGNDTLLGYAGDDQLYGEEGDDVLFGQDGNDLLDGGVGNDALLGGRGDDVLWGGEGDDELQGNDGNDKLMGQAGHDQLFGQAGHDQLWGGAGNDELQGGEGNDQLDGGSGNDKLFGQVGNDILLGGDGDDLLVGFTASNETKQSLAAGETDDDVLSGGNGNDNLYGGVGNDQLMGDAGDDLLLGQDGNDRLWGGDGKDELQGGAGDDQLDGGAGDDRLFGQVGNDIIWGGEGNDLLMGFTGSNEAKQTLAAGESDDDFLYGGAGNDTLVGGVGNDYLDGGAGADIMIGGQGDDVYIVNSVNDTIYEKAGEGYDTVITSSNYLLNANIEELRLLEGYTSTLPVMH